MAGLPGAVPSILAAVLSSAGAQSGSPRLLVKLTGAAGPDVVRATIENLAPRPVALSLVPAFALRPSGPDEEGWPAFRAPIDLRTAKPLAVRGRAVLELAPKERQTVVVPLESLYWDHYESVFWPSRPLHRVVLPGRYDLVLELEHPDSGNWWRSDPIAAIVKKAGRLQIVR